MQLLSSLFEIDYAYIRNPIGQDEIYIDAKSLDKVS